jgi:hypothetical protein
MWIKAILPIGVLALAFVPRPAAIGTPAPPPVRTAAAIPFTSICRDGELPVSRPDPAWVETSFSNDGCRLAPVPAAINGASVPREKIVAAMAEAKRYEAAADAFGKCVGTFVTAHAQGSNRLTGAQAIIENHRLLAGQKSRQAATAQTRAAIEAFNEYGIDCSG